MFKRYRFPSVLISTLLVFTAGYVCAQPKILSTGVSAPLFTAKASLAGKEFDFSLKKSLAKGPVVVYFYPSAYTGGCDLEAHTFANMKDQFTAAGATIIGVSADDIQRLNKFSSDPDFCAGKFPVASDPGGKIAASYGLTISPSRQGAKDVRGEEINHGFIPRTTFVINKEGKIAAVYSSNTDHITPDEHVKKALAMIKGM